MSTENRVERWFEGLDGLEELCEMARVRVTKRDITKVELAPNETLRLGVEEASCVGLRLLVGGDDAALMAALAESKLPPEDVRMLLLAEDRFLKERKILHEFDFLQAFPGEHFVTGVDGDRPGVLSNPFGGFELSLLFVLGRDLDHGVPRRPHRKGTILARSTWTVKGQRSIGGLDPLPLTDDVRKAADLPASTLLYVECQDDILMADDLTGVRVYVHEGLLARLVNARGADRTTVLQQLSIDALTQFMYIVAKQIDEGWVWDGVSSAALRLIHAALKKTGMKVTPDELAALLRDGTPRLVAAVSGLEKQANRLVDMFKDDQAEETE